jgi:hypothetical protein
MSGLAALFQKMCGSAVEHFEKNPSHQLSFPGKSQVQLLPVPGKA